MALIDHVAALLGVSTYERPAQRRSFAYEPDEAMVAKIREEYGGQLSPMPFSKTRWYLRDIESAERSADQGDLGPAARLMRAARKDGVYHGLLGTRTTGLVQLRKVFRGTPEIVAALKQTDEKTRCVFDEMCPSTELALLEADGFELGVGVAELVPVLGREYPVLVRLDPEFLQYRWNENRWYFKSVAGMLPITPGDGRWVLHTPGGRVAPWQHGAWRAIGRAIVRKEHAMFHSDNWEAKLANPARVATAPLGSSQKEKDSWFTSVMSWGVNTVFGMLPGYDVKLVESNGRGWESFQKTEAKCDNELIMIVCGQTVTTDGGAGFSNSDIHKSIRADLIKGASDGLAYTVNTQILPGWIAESYGEDALTPGAVVAWDVTPPKDRAQEAQSMVASAQAITSLTKALAAHGLALDVRALVATMGIPTMEVAKGGARALVLDEIAAVSAAAAECGKKLDEATVDLYAALMGCKLEENVDNDDEISVEVDTSEQQEASI